MNIRPTNQVELGTVPGHDEKIAHDYRSKSLDHVLV